MDRTRNVEESRRRGAYHEAAHAVVDVMLDNTVRYVSIETEGTDYQDNCVTAVTPMESEGMGLIPVPRQALGLATSTLAGNMAMSRVAGKPYPRESWQDITRECEEIEELGDPELLESDVMKVRKYCEAAALIPQNYHEMVVVDLVRFEVKALQQRPLAELSRIVFPDYVLYGCLNAERPICGKVRSH